MRLVAPRVWGVVAAGLAAGACGDTESFSETHRGCLRATAIDFGGVPIRTEQRQIVPLVNCGTLPVHELSAQVVAPPTSAGPSFYIEATTAPVPLEVGDRVLLPVIFRPRAVGPVAATLELRFDDPTAETPTVTAALTGVGVTGDRCAAELQASADFGVVLVGDRVQRSLTLTHVGERACAIEGVRIAEGGLAYEVDAAPTALAPSETASIDIGFAPLDEGPTPGALLLVLTETEPSSGVRYETVLQASLTGEGTITRVCALTAYPDALVFPRATANAAVTATHASFAVSNTGDGDCTLGAAVLVSGDAHFAIDSAPSAGTVLPSGDSATVAVTFAPTLEGAQTGEVAIAAAEGPSLSVPLSGFADPEAVCALRFTPDPIAFPPTGVALDSELPVSVHNESPVDCDITQVTITSASSPDFSLLDPSSAVGLLAPGADASVTVRFTPTTGAPANGALLVEVGLDEPEQAALVGYGAYARLTLEPLAHQFGFITEGCASDPLLLALKNVGTTAARVDNVFFSAYSDPSFEILAAPPAGSMLAAGATASITARALGSSAYGGNRAELLVSSTGTSTPILGSQLLEESESEEEAARVELFLQTAIPTLDILFVIDDSGSMSDNQANLAANSQSFIQFFTSDHIVDFHIGVVTTDTATNGGALVAPYIDDTTPDPVAAFVAAANVGTGGSADEQGILASVLALSPPHTDPGHPNDGFLRPEAVLAIVYVSDEEDHSPATVPTYVAQLEALKGNNPAAVIVSAIAGDVPGGCAANGVSADAGDRYFAITAAFGGEFVSICDPDWASKMQQIGGATFEALTKFELDREPELDTLTVVVTYPDGTVVEVPRYDPTAIPPVFNGWSLDPTNHVVFHGDAVPGSGAQVAISYVTECLAP